jgi:hypothetical protein
VSLPVFVPAGWVVTATATDPANNTSEFSAWIPVVIVPQVQSSAVNPTNLQFSLSWTNNGGSYVLQQTLSLNPPQQWITVTNAPLFINKQFLCVDLARHQRRRLLPVAGAVRHSQS